MPSPLTLTWSGVFPALTTPFRDDGAVDLPAFQAQAARQLDAGVDGLVVLGSLGENATLDREEKLAVVGAAAEACRGRAPLVVTVAEQSTRNGCAFMEAAATAGADGFMALHGTLYPSDPRETEAHFRTLAKATDRPIMLYNNPLAYKVDLTPDLLESLADEPAFQALKESSGDVRRITDLRNRLGGRYAIFTGVDDLALESLLLGAVGWVAGLVCAFPAETVALYRLAKAGRVDEAVALYRWFMPLLHLDVGPKFVQNIKLAEALAGTGSEAVRAPRLRLAGEERERVEAVLRRALATRPALPVLAEVP
ncbi:MAG: dihydrodipicolinate synthase family protein [Holophagaceae bacterium]